MQAEHLAISLSSALELCQLGLGTLVDIRQNFELEVKGAIPGAVHIPLFEVKRLLGHALSEDEQDTLDAGKPNDLDVQGFFTMINKVHHVHDHIVLCICNSGRRSLYAARLLLGGRLIELTATPQFFEAPSDPRTAAFVRGDMVY